MIGRGDSEHQNPKRSRGNKEGRRLKFSVAHSLFKPPRRRGGQPRAKPETSLDRGLKTSPRQGPLIIDCVKIACKRFFEARKRPPAAAGWSFAPPRPRSSRPSQNAQPRERRAQSPLARDESSILKTRGRGSGIGGEGSQRGLRPALLQAEPCSNGLLPERKTLTTAAPFRPAATAASSCSCRCLAGPDSERPDSAGPDTQPRPPRRSLGRVVVRSRSFPRCRRHGAQKTHGRGAAAPWAFPGAEAPGEFCIFVEA